MKAAIVTGSGGLVGSEAVRLLCENGWHVIGIDNDMRASYFGESASTAGVTFELVDRYPEFRNYDVDIRDREKVDDVFAGLNALPSLIVHAAAQPSHDWAARAPYVDFDVNARGTLNLLEASRRNCPEATFCTISTNKVYGDTPNRLPLRERSTRFEIVESHRWYPGIDTSMSLDRSTHSLFGVSKTAADLMTQEYGRYFGMPTVCFRCGCITGGAHQGAELHGFLAYLVKCAVEGRPYTVFGYGGRQVRDNIAGRDVALACLEFHEAPRPGSVYNLGGGRRNSLSVLEAIEAVEETFGADLDVSFTSEPRVGDHRWWISDLSEFKRDYRGWDLTMGIADLLLDIGGVRV